MTTPRSRIDAPRGAALALGLAAQEVGEESADERRRVELERQVHAEREDQRRHAEHLHDHGDHGAGAEQDVGDRLAGS